MKNRRTERLNRRVSPALVISVGVHLLVAVALMRILVIPDIRFFGWKRGSVPVERVGFLKLTKNPGREPTPGRDGGNGKTVTSDRETKLVAPVRIPTILPVTPPASHGVTEEGTGPLVGTGGPARGIKPIFSDPRLWGLPGKIVSAPRTLKQDLDSIIASSVGVVNDSIAASRNTPRWENGDWTFEKNGRKYGIDQRFIRLGPVSIPTALLAMLPLNVTGNPTVAERNRSLNYMHRDITEHAQQAINQADFNKAVRSIRERKERARAAAQQTAAPAADSGSVPPR